MNTKDYEDVPEETPVRNRALKVGDVITISGLNPEISCAVINGVKREWITVDCTGAVNNIALATLIGTMKVVKYFGEEIASDPRRLVLPHTKKEAAMAIMNMVGKTYEVVKKKTVFLERYGNDKTFYVFFEKSSED